MRALRVYESIDFERGIEPKDSLRIGRKYVRVKAGDILKAYFDYDWPDIKKGGFVVVKAVEDEEENDKMFDGAIIHPKIKGLWSVTFNNNRGEWEIVEG